VNFVSIIFRRSTARLAGPLKNEHKRQIKLAKNSLLSEFLKNRVSGHSTVKLKNE